MFHRVDDPLDLPSSRFFRMADRLPLRGGAVTDAIATARPHLEQPLQEVTTQPAPHSPSVDVDNSDEIAALAARSQNPGFPGIGYSGG